MTLKLEHLGHFSLPRGVQAQDPALPAELAKHAKFGYGGRAMALSANGEHLWISGSDQGDLVASVVIKEPGEKATGALHEFHELTPRAALSAAKLDQLVGLAAHGGLCGLWQDYYDVDGKDGGRVSLWNGERLVQVGSGALKKHAGYLTAYDSTLWCGRSDGAGSADVQHGPALYRISMPLLNYGLEGFSIPPRPDWTEADRYTGLVFLPGHVCWLVSKDVVPRREEVRDGKLVLVHPWYGGQVSPEGLVDRWNEGKGYHTERREAWLLVYTWPGLEERSPIVLREFYASAKCGGIAYDAERRRLYVHQAWAPPQVDAIPWETPRIEVYAVSTDEAAEPEPPARETLYVQVGFPSGRLFAGEIEEVGG